ncbi:hypothetical protein FRC10_003029 [Ceratobasidium sp. 414]|nr:hypothetical protein FRC10_003029 [Ceratobasidium sp. 414]
MLHPPAVFEIAKLPRLSSLTIIASNNGPHTINVPLPSDSFPVLNRLELRRIAVHDLEILWDMVPLVRNVVEVEIETLYYDDPEIWLRLARKIPSNSPRISKLYLDRQGDYKEPRVLSLEFLRHFWLLPLTSLVIARGALDPQTSLLDFTSGLPRTLETFHMYGPKVGFETLLSLAKHFPLLRNLALKLVEG